MHGIERQPIKSSREDGRGHWPKGKSRSTLTAAERAFVLRRLRRAAKDFSIRQIARTLEVSDRSIRRILSGEDQPSERIRDLVKGRL